MQARGVDRRLVVYGGALYAFHHPPVDQTVLPGVGHHPRHSERAWRHIAGLLAECLHTPALAHGLVHDGGDGAGPSAPSAAARHVLGRA